MVHDVASAHHNFYRLPQIRSERPTWDYHHPDHLSRGHGDPDDATKLEKESAS